MIIISILTFLLILTIVVFIHELGHFLVARKNGVLVEEFGLGMPPRMIGVQKVGNTWKILTGHQAPDSISHTIYSLNWLPLGGFVKLYGDGAGGEGGHIDPQYQSLSLESKSVWARFAIMVSGVIMNLLLAIIIYHLLLARVGFVSEHLPILGDASFRFGTQIQSVGVVGVRPGSPAEKAGIRPESIILRIRPHTDCPGVPCASAPWQPIVHTSDLIDMVKAHDGRPVDVELQKSFLNREQQTVTVTPEYDQKEKRALIGIQLIKFVSLDYREGTTRVFAGLAHAWNLTSYNLQMQRTIISQAFKSGDASIAGDAVGGPVAIASVVNETIKRSGSDVYTNLLSLTALISLSLAFMNILPIPALDGGRIALLIPEMITGRRVNHKFERYLNIGGFAVLIGLSILITIKDVIGIFR